MQAGELDKLLKSVLIIYVTLTTMNASTILQQDLCISASRTTACCP